MTFGTTVCLVICLSLAIRGLGRVRGTTLTTAFRWLVAGILLWLIATVLQAVLPIERSGWGDLMNYAAAVVLLCPGVAVLGSRRPGAAAWGFFVLIPLVLVLMWPAVASVRTVRSGVPLELEEPAVIGFAIVLVMSSGNYFGTRYTLPTILFAATEILLVAPLSATVPDLFPTATTARLLAAASSCCAAVIVTVRAGWRIPVQNQWDSVWLDFLDSYGLVWGKRVMDRLNDAARHEKWALQLDWPGFVPAPRRPGLLDDSQTDARLDHFFRWLLKRFVSPDWIDRRLEPGERQDPSGSTSTETASV